MSPLSPWWSGPLGCSISAFCCRCGGVLSATHPRHLRYSKGFLCCRPHLKLLFSLSTLACLRFFPSTIHLPFFVSFLNHLAIRCPSSRTSASVDVSFSLYAVAPGLGTLFAYGALCINARLITGVPNVGLDPSRHPFSMGNVRGNTGYPYAGFLAFRGCSHLTRFILVW